MTTKKWAMILGVALVGGMALAATEKFDRYGGAFPVFFDKGMYVGPVSPAPTGDKLNKVTRMLAATATVDFTVISTGRQESSAITVTGAQTNDTCTVGANATAAALAADFSCYVSAADTVKIRFMPNSKQSGSCTLGGQSPSVCPAQTVTAGSVCTCSPVATTAALAAAGCAVSVASTTLTITSLNAGSHVINYDCLVPVDPASGEFRVFVRSNK